MQRVHQSWSWVPGSRWFSSSLVRLLSVVRVVQQIMICNHDYSLNVRCNCLRHLSFNNFEGAGDCYAGWMLNQVLAIYLLILVTLPLVSLPMLLSCVWVSSVNNYSGLFSFSEKKNIIGLTNVLSFHVMFIRVACYSFNIFFFFSDKEQVGWFGFNNLHGLQVGWFGVVTFSTCQ